MVTETDRDEELSEDWLDFVTDIERLEEDSEDFVTEIERLELDSEV